MGFSRQEYWSGLPFTSPVDHILRPLHHDLTALAGPPTAWLSFIELEKTVVLWADWLVFCDYGFSVSALWCPLTTPTVLLGFLLPWMWGISSRLLQQSAAAAPYLGRGVSSQGRPSWPWTWSSFSQPFCARAAAAPWMWGCSSRPPPLTSGVGKLLCAAPALSQPGALACDLRRGVASHGHTSEVYHSKLKFCTHETVTFHPHCTLFLNMNFITKT